ncbi:MAG: hypothetical protein ACHQFX_15110 [Chitinophagales bacterium]
MKQILLIGSIAVIALFYSCEKKHFDTTASIKITLYTCKNPVISGDQVNICFDSLLTESRCPIYADCIWRGFAAGKFSFSANGKSHSIRLSEFAVDGMFRKDTILAGYKIEFIDLEPYPGTVSEPVPADKIKAEIKITKL